MTIYPLEQIDLARERYESFAPDAPWNQPNETHAEREAHKERIADDASNRFYSADWSLFSDAIWDKDETVGDVLRLLKTTNDNEQIGLVIRSALAAYCAKLAEKEHD